MKINTRILTLALATSLLSTGLVYAQQPAPRPVAAPAAAAAQPAQLAPDRLKFYKDSQAQIRAKNGPLRAQVKQMYKDLNAISTADTFDKTAYLAKTAEIEKAETQLHTNRYTAMAAVLPQFSASERRIIFTPKKRKNQN